LEATKENAFNTLRRIFERDNREDSKTGGVFTLGYAELMQSEGCAWRVAHVAMLLDEAYSMGVDSGLNMKKPS